MEAAVKASREGQDLSGQGGILTPLLKQLIEAAMQADL
jgi:putative transposase